MTLIVTLTPMLTCIESDARPNHLCLRAIEYVTAYRVCHSLDPLWTTKSVPFKASGTCADLAVGAVVSHPDSDLTFVIYVHALTQLSVDPDHDCEAIPRATHIDADADPMCALFADPEPRSEILSEAGEEWQRGRGAAAAPQAPGMVALLLDE